MDTILRLGKRQKPRFGQFCDFQQVKPIRGFNNLAHLIQSQPENGFIEFFGHLPFPDESQIAAVRRLRAFAYVLRHILEFFARGQIHQGAVRLDG